MGNQICRPANESGTNDYSSVFLDSLPKKKQKRDSREKCIKEKCIKEKYIFPNDVVNDLDCIFLIP